MDSVVHIYLILQGIIECNILTDIAHSIFILFPELLVQSEVVHQTQCNQNSTLLPSLAFTITFVMCYFLPLKPTTKTQFITQDWKTLNR